VVVVIVVGWLLVSTWNAVLASHPAYLISLLVVAAVAILVALLPPRRHRRHSRIVGILGRVLQVCGLVLLLGALVWLRPVPADQVAVAAMTSDAAVTVTSSPTTITLEPTANSKATGLIFYPGARIDARAYVALLRPLAEAGFPVVVIKEPFGVGFLAPEAAADVIAANPDVERWMVGGHSLGGVEAASFAARHPEQVDGLLLWGSYPADQLADATDLAVTSIWGTRDGLTQADDIEASKRNLPPGTTFVTIQGADHAYFGDYGVQAGDGTPTVSRESAQKQIVAASLAAMKSLDSSR